MKILSTSEFAKMVVSDAALMSANARLAARISRRLRLTYCEMASKFFSLSEPRVPILVIDDAN